MKIKWQDLAKSRMKKLSMSQEELAELLEVTQGAVGHWVIPPKNNRVHK